MIDRLFRSLQSNLASIVVPLLVAVTHTGLWISCTTKKNYVSEEKRHIPSLLIKEKNHKKCSCVNTERAHPSISMIVLLTSGLHRRVADGVQAASRPAV
jgi:hypothetical protein